MRGRVKFVDSFTGEALVTGVEGGDYTFRPPAGAERLRVDESVDFTPDGDLALDVFSLDRGVPLRPRGWRPKSAAYDLPWAMFSFSGRMRRSHFWISSIALFVIWLVVAGYLRISFVTLLMIWPNLAVGVKRLHDMGRSGGLVAVPYVVGVVGTIALTVGVASTTGGSNSWVALFPLVTMTVCLAFWLWLGVAKTQPGTNAHGADPKSAIDETVEAFS